MENQSRLDIAFYRKEVADRVRLDVDVDRLDFGPLLDWLVTTPYYLAKVEEDGTIKLEIQRKHEWQLIIIVILAGSAVFMKGVLSELGKRTGGWLADQVAKLKTGRQPEICVGKNVVRIDPAAPSQTEAAVEALLVQGIETSEQVQIIVEPRR